MDHNQRASAVFHDPRRRRWKFVSIGVSAAAVAVTVLFGITLLSVLISPILPRLGLKPFASLPQARHLAFDASALGVHTNRRLHGDYRPRGDRPDRIARRSPARPFYGSLVDNRDVPPYAETAKGLGESIPATPTRSLANGPRSKLIGFYVNWDDSSLLSLKQHLNSFDLVIPEWLHVAGPAGGITLDDPVTEQLTLQYIRQHRPGLPVMPLVNNYDQANQTWDSANLTKNLHDPAMRAAIAKRLLDYVRSQHLAGINIDFENLQPASRDDLVAFMQQVSAEFHTAGLKVSQAVPANDPAYDYARLAAASDFLTLMVYDQHASGTDPGPVAAQSWFTGVLARRAKDIPANKLVVGIGSYGYDWAQGQPTQPVTFEQALATAHSGAASPTLDPASLTLHYAYADANRVTHNVWLLDAVSAFDQISATAASHPAGIALWRLGSEDPTIWPVLENRDHLTGQVAQSLNTIDLSQGVAYQGTGEVLKVTGKPVRGERATAYDPNSGLITSERIVHWAQPFIITRWGGGVSKKIALTFDDGPDPNWTPQILDVLDTNNVPATFFVVGTNANANPSILTRELAIGEEIGNHTYTHPDIAAISPYEVKWQLDAVQRLLESMLGVRSVLFRPPYGEDAQPDTPKQVAPLMQTGELGYYTVGMNIDPNDWARPGVQQIIDRTVAQVESGRGHVVLLHDGGGDRSQTAAALPTIIRKLRADGYTFVTVSDLVSLPRGTVMPTVPARDRFFATIDRASFSFMDWVRIALYWTFVAGIVLGIARLIIVGTLALVERIRAHTSANQTFPADYAPLTSVIVPAFNEELVIVSSVEALLASDYQHLQIIVVDDGSTDATYQTAVDAFSDELRVRILTKANAGKANALNFGIEHAEGEVVIGMDADTLFRPDAISKLVRHFSRPEIGAVAGNAKVGNRVNVLTRWQALEYITNQNLDRRAFDLLNCITVVPGAIGAWRRELIIEAGGFADDTLAEDADLTLRVLRHGARIVYEDEAIADTEAPDTIRGLAKQRSRWVFGTMQTFWKHRAVLGRPSAGTLGTVAMPNVLIFQILFQLISPIMDLVMVLSVITVLVQRQQHPLDWSAAGFEHILFYYALFVALDFATSALAFALELHGEQWSLLWWLFPQRFFYRQLMYVVVWRALVNAVRGTVQGWQKLERKANVAATTS